MSFYDSICGQPSKTHLKFVLLGDGATGKTSYFNRMCDGDDPDYTFEKKYIASQGCSVAQIGFNVGRHEITVHLFDTAGQEKFGQLRDSYLMGADGIILMYDITNKDTKRNVLSKWIPDITRVLKKTNEKKYIPIMVVGNKNDRSSKVKLEPYEMLGIRKSALVGAYASKHYGEIDHCIVSVKADENLMEPVSWLLKTSLSYYFPITVTRSKNKTKKELFRV